MIRYIDDDMAKHTHDRFIKETIFLVSGNGRKNYSLLGTGARTTTLFYTRDKQAKC